MNNMGNEIPRVNEKVVEKLLDIGILFIGTDNQLHVTEKDNTSEK